MTRREFKAEKEGRRPRMLSWTLKCVTDTCDVEGVCRPDGFDTLVGTTGSHQSPQPEVREMTSLAYWIWPYKFLRI